MGLGVSQQKSTGGSGPRVTADQADFRRSLGGLLSSILSQNQNPSLLSTQLPTQFLGLLDKDLATNLETGQGRIAGSATPLSGAGRAAVDRNALSSQVGLAGTPTRGGVTQTQRGQAAFGEEQFAGFLNSLLG